MDSTFASELIASHAVARHPAPALAEATIRVAYAGRPPWWHELPAAVGELEPIAVSHVDLRSLGTPLDDPPAVVHVSAESLARTRELRRAAPGSALVADLTESASVSPRLARRLARTDLVLVGSLDGLRELRRRFPGLAKRSALLRRPVDVGRFAPEPVLAESRGRDLRRFRRFHRLGGPMMLFAGPYTEGGGLDSLLEAAYALRAELEPELRLCAVPLGPVDRRYLDGVERRALRLGHHGVIEWSCEEDELPLWFGCADVVCVPTRDDIHPDATLLAAAAGRPFVGSDLDASREDVVDGQTGYLIPTDDHELLVATLRALLGDPEERARIGAAARERALAQLSPAAAGSRLRELWATAAAAMVT